MRYPGIPAASIERIATDGGDDTVVIESRGLGALARFLQDSVSVRVAGHAHATAIGAR